jgi:hypothetical protein
MKSLIFCNTTVKEIELLPFSGIKVEAPAVLGQ